MITSLEAVAVPQPVDRHEPDGIDYAWIMQVTFILTILVGAPLVALASIGVDLATWEERARFALAIGAMVWLGTGLTVYLFARRTQSRKG